MITAFIRIVSIMMFTVSAAPAVMAETPLTVIHQNLSADPGWDNYQNRVIGTNMPVTIQDFGWDGTRRLAGSSDPAVIGGRLTNSRTPAYYAMPLVRPFSFNDTLSFSGRLSITGLERRGVAYFGFFNSTRHTWRVYSSMAFRLWEEDNAAQVMCDWMSGDWRGRGAETAVLIPPDGSVHTFRFSYDPDARPDPVWKDATLQRIVTGETGNGRPYELQGEEFLLERSCKIEPGLTADELHRRLIALRDKGLVEYFHRHNQHRWWKMPSPEKLHGRIVLAFDDDTPYVLWFDEDIRRAPAEFDRFGLFNVCRYGGGITVHFSDLTLNGRLIGLARDPGWTGINNRASWTEPDFHSMNDFGWTRTNHAGSEPGEMGGLIWRLEPEDPAYSFYADETGTLTLDDPIEFSGRVCFYDGMTDASMFFGYFNRDEFMRPADRKQPVKISMLGFDLNDATSDGYFFHPMSSASDGASSGEGKRYTLQPDRLPHRFTFRYDPLAGNGIGRVSYTLDGREGGFDLTPAQRKAGARFDRFGLATVRRGGNSVEIYFDDLTYTVRRDPDAPPVRHKQTITTRPYPARSAGREY